MSDTRKRGISRRALFKGAGAAAASGAVFGSLEAMAEEARSETRVLGPGGTEIEVEVNGGKRTLAVEPRTTLLDALRLRLDLTGAKPVCDRSQCGACTILLDGDPVYACSVLAVEAEGRAVTTVEGLGSPEDMSPMQKAFVEHDALQCGFCTPGFVVSCTAAAREHGADLDEGKLRAATCGNLCRCGTYPHVIKAALQAAKGN